MNDDTVRVGLVSSVNQDTGMVRVTYPDRDREVTPELPFFKMGNEYQMPEVNDMVLVLHLSNDSSMGIVMGASGMMRSFLFPERMCSGRDFPGMEDPFLG